MPVRKRRQVSARSRRVTAGRGLAKRKRLQRRGRQRRGPRRIDAFLKGTTIAAQPPINADPANLSVPFRTKLEAALAHLAAGEKPFKLVEGFRTKDRQQWLFGSGRPTVVPHGRPGPILTNADGVAKKSKHQGNGKPGSGRAADCYPMKNGKVHIPPSSDPVWELYAQTVEQQGLTAGHHFSSFKDSPHTQLK